MYAPHSVAPARRVSLLASGLPGSSLLPPRLPPCSVGRGSSWVLRLRLLLLGWLDLGSAFPVYVSVGGLDSLVPVARVP